MSRLNYDKKVCKNSQHAKALIDQFFFQGLLVNLSTALHRDTIATASTLNRLHNNITYLHMAMNKLISVVNYTLADQTQVIT